MRERERAPAPLLSPAQCPPAQVTSSASQHLDGYLDDVDRLNRQLSQERGERDMFPILIQVCMADHC